METRASLYAFLGPDYQQKLEAVTQIQKAHSGAEFLSYSMLHDEVVALIDSLNHRSLYAPHRVISVTHFEALAKKKQIQALLQYFNNPSEDITLVCMSDAVRLQKPFAQGIPHAQQRIFWERRPQKRITWLIEQAARAHCRLDPDAAALLAEMAGGLQKDLTEVLKPVLALRKEQISRDDLAVLPVRAKRENVFSLIDACCTHDAQLAVRILHQLLNSNESPVSIVVRMQVYFRKLHKVALAVSRGVAEREACTELGITGKRPLQEAIRYLRTHHLSKIRMVLLTLYQADIYLRGYPEATHQTILELCILYVVHDRSWTSAEPVVGMRMTTRR